MNARTASVLLVVGLSIGWVAVAVAADQARPEPGVTVDRSRSAVRLDAVLQSP